MNNTLEKDLNIGELMALSKSLYEKNKENWSPMEPEYGKDFILYMVEELGEVIAIIKKKSTEDIMEDETVRHAFVTELCDVLMYYIDVLNRFHITPEEFTEIYLSKYEKNLGRDYKEQYSKYLK